jgi:signal transduction histidine kinase
MTMSTSPHRGSLSQRWADALAIRGRTAGGADRRSGRLALARGTALLHLLALGLILIMAWQGEPGGAAGGLPALHLVLLIATGAAATLVALRSGEWAAPAAPPAWAAEAGPQLLAQLSHELRTPLNAMIGFSEVMLCELHGPLGDARYQEYAAYINESGGQLLKASEETLAVTATMSALMADGRALRRERVRAATLVQEAWAAASAFEPAPEVHLSVAASLNSEIECDGRATGRALEHLLREALERTPPDGAVEARAHHEGYAACIEIRVLRRLPLAVEPVGHGRRSGGAPDGGGLKVMLARSLLELQGASLRFCPDPAAVWSICVALPSARRRLDI